MKRFAGVLAVLLAVSEAACRKSAPVPPPPADYAVTVEQWRAKHESDYRRDWVSIAGLHELKMGANSVGSAAASDIRLPEPVPPAIGSFVRDGGSVRFEPAAGSRVLLMDQPVTAALTLQDDSVSDPDELLVGEVRLVIHKSGDTPSLRVRDPNGPLARDFRGFQWFPIDPQYRVTGRFIRDPAPRRMPVLNTYGDIDSYATEGVVEFNLLGQTLRLRPFTTRPTRFYFVFKDASSGRETYGAARFVYANLLNDGTTVIDFNEAFNPPCAFNPYTTCPIPLPENRLPVKILAGEKDYPVHVPLRTKPSTGNPGS